MLSESRFTASESTSDAATVIVMSSSNSVTSAVISTYSGTSISSNTSLIFVSSIPESRQSLSPGTAYPTTIFLDPSEITLPFSTCTFENLSASRIAPESITNGVTTSLEVPFTSIAFFVLFV